MPAAIAEAPVEEQPAEPTEEPMVTALEETADEAQVVERAMVPEAENLGGLRDTEEVAISPEAEVETQEETLTASQSRPVLELAIGLGIATVIMAAITYWISRRTLG